MNLTEPMLSPVSASSLIDRLASSLAAASVVPGEQPLDTLIADALRRVSQVVDADYVMLSNERGDVRHVWSRPGAVVGREPRVCVAVTAGRGGSYELSIGIHRQGAIIAPPLTDALRGLATVMVLLLDRDGHHDRHDARRDTTAAHIDDSSGSDEFENIIGDSPALRRALYRVQQVAPTDASVMLLGETGTGKEMFARAIHNRSVRSGKPFVRVNCAALPSTLIETELFGHVRGAFTGAVSTRQGRFEVADGGTLFLDEIGDLPADVQAKLLRVLQEGEFERVGSSQSHKVDVRIVAATHHDLETAMTQGRFRADLYYRLNVFPIVLPPLRQRTEDIPRLVWYFVNRRQRALNRKFTNIPVSVYASLQQRPWPGNVRELQNVIERAMIHSSGDTLTLDETPSSMPPVTERGPATLEDVERQYVQDALQRCRWRINGRGNAAETLGLHPNTLRNRMKKFGIQRPQPPSTRLTA